MIEEQSSIIVDLNDRIRQQSDTAFDEEQADNADIADIATQDERAKQKPEADIKPKTNKVSGNTKQFCQLYQKASEKKCESDDDYEDINDDDDNDSFITIDTDDEAADSDGTIENTESSDSGYTDYQDNSPNSEPFHSSFGVNPLFASRQDGTEACQEDFIFFNREVASKDERRDLQTIPEKEVLTTSPVKDKPPAAVWTGSLKRSHKIVIINNQSALVCNESCLI